MKLYIYGDETGNLDFSNREEASQYFILTTVTVDDHAVENSLMQLRREIVWESWEDVRLPNSFHASNDNKHVRRRVFDLLTQHTFRVDVTLLEKRKANPSIRVTDAQFYGTAWYYHLTGLVPALAPESEELLVIAASIGNNDMRSNFNSVVEAIASAVAPATVVKSDMWSASTAPLLQVADYCAWAIQRKWERSPGDTEAYDLIRGKIASEFDVFRRGATTYY